MSKHSSIQTFVPEIPIGMGTWTDLIWQLLRMIICSRFWRILLHRLAGYIANDKLIVRLGRRLKGHEGFEKLPLESGARNLSLA
jgi:hypothetical protein